MFDDKGGRGRRGREKEERFAIFSIIILCHFTTKRSHMETNNGLVGAKTVQTVYVFDCIIYRITIINVLSVFVNLYSAPAPG